MCVLDVGQLPLVPLLSLSNEGELSSWLTLTLALTLSKTWKGETHRGMCLVSSL